MSARGRAALAGHSLPRTWERCADAAVINLKSLSGTANDDIWAVGSDAPPGVVAKSARSYHWDGSSWSKVRVGLTGYSDLSAVVAIAPDDV